MSNSDIGEPLANCEAIKTGYAQKKGGRFVTFLLNDGPDDNYQPLAELELGAVVQLFVTIKDNGIG